MNKVIFFDLDGVLVDFVGGSCLVHNRERPTPCPWDFYKGWGLADEAAFWGPLSNSQFWAGLPALVDGMGLLGILGEWESEKADAGILTGVKPPVIGVLSSGLCPGSVDGKLDWLRLWCPGLVGGAVFTPHKHLVAAPGKLLIDDNDSNCERFRAAGGAAVLVPRPWNARSAECDGPEGVFDPVKIADEVIAWAAS